MKMRPFSDKFHNCAANYYHYRKSENRNEYLTRANNYMQRILSVHVTVHPMCISLRVYKKKKKISLSELMQDLSDFLLT